jgi:hypothetical protein
MKLTRPNDGESNVSLLARGDDELKNIIIRFGEMFREHVSGYNATIKELTERVEDLEGHAEHGSDGTCGICLPEEDSPETVGAPEYGDLIVADFDGECADPFCDDKIIPGDEVVAVAEGKFLHEQCKH